MKVSTILDHIDSGHMALPEFQRGYVWNRDQIRALMASLYRRHPVGSLLTWATRAGSAAHRGDGPTPEGTLKLLLDGQQRMTSLYGVIRGKAPEFFDGKPGIFEGLNFHLETEEFQFQPSGRGKDDPRWVDVTDLLHAGHEGFGAYIQRLSADPDLVARLGAYTSRLNQLLGIREIDFHVEEVTGADKTIDVVVDIFNRVNSGGTKLSKGDLALAKVCADWPEARTTMREARTHWHDNGFKLDQDWLLRCMNVIVTGEAKFLHLHDVETEKVRDGLTQARAYVDQLLNLIGSRLGLDHDRVFFGRYSLPVLVRYLHLRQGKLPEAGDQGKMLFWYLQAALWGRFSGSTESMLDRDLEILDRGPSEEALDRLIEELRTWRGSLRVTPENFRAWSRGARFYPLLYLLTRTQEARDWGNGLPLKAGMLGKLSRLQVHHVFPKALLYKARYSRPQVNAVANFCFLTQESNLEISDRPPAEYFAEIEKKHPGALASQWIPEDPALHQLDRYPDFLAARQALLAEAANRFLESLYGAALPADEPALAPSHEEPPPVPGGIASQDEEQALRELNVWVTDQGLAEGELAYELIDPVTNEPTAILDLAWPEGLQEGYSEPVAVLLDEPAETLAAASEAGFRFFTSVEAFRRHAAPAES